MKRYLFLLNAVCIPVLLTACTPSKNSNANVVVIDLTNAATNTASALNQNTNTSVGNSNTNVASNANAALSNTNVSQAASITVNSSGFSPSSLTVKVGTMVTWTNSSGGEVFIASDPHPTHTDLPGLSSGAVANGGTYSFTFVKIGTWGYHDHLDPTLKGSVTVQ
jgi:plastocyanin